MGRWLMHQSDTNAEALYQAARDLGIHVSPIGQPVDALFGAYGVTVAVEVKTAKGKLRPKQVAFLRAFGGWAVVLRTVEDVITLHDEMRLRAIRWRCP